MSAFDTAQGRACDLAAQLANPQLDGVTPLERIALADPECRRASNESTLRWCEMSQEDREWLLLCDQLCSLAAKADRANGTRKAALGAALALYGGHLIAEADPRDEIAAAVEDAGWARLEAALAADDEPFEAF